MQAFRFAAGAVFVAAALAVGRPVVAGKRPALVVLPPHAMVLEMGVWTGAPRSDWTDAARENLEASLRDATGASTEYEAVHPDALTESEAAAVVE